MTHTVMTFLAKVKPEKRDALRALLAEIGDKPEDNAYIPFRKLALLHFASLVLHESQPDYGFYLIFENNFDGALAPYLDDLYRQAADGLHQIYSSCQDYTVTNAGDRAGMLSYLKAHVVLPNAYHIGNTGRGAQRILQERDLKNTLETAADKLVEVGQPRAPRELLDALRNPLRTDPKFAWIPGAGPRQNFMEKAIPWAKFVLAAVLSVLTLPIWFIPAVVGLLVLRYKESTDSIQLNAANSDRVRSLVQQEDHTQSVGNHMASITIVKEGWLRRFALRTVLWAVNLYVRATQTHGVLSGIPSIHFAHWSMIDGGRRLLFLSNFDGSWENYLDDFIDKAAVGLTGVWSNTVGFPRTQWLVFGGARDGPRFKAVARDSQVVTNAWYSAYRDVTVQGIDNSSSLREDIYSPLDTRAAEACLQRL